MLIEVARVEGAITDLVTAGRSKNIETDGKMGRVL
jgi:hypothetical protein